MLRAIATLLIYATAAMLVFLGFEYIHVGQGLNPWLAFPTAILFVVGINLLLQYEADKRECALADLLEQIESEALCHANYYKGRLFTFNQRPDKTSQADICREAVDCFKSIVNLTRKEETHHVPQRQPS